MSYIGHIQNPLWLTLYDLVFNFHHELSDIETVNFLRDKRPLMDCRKVDKFPRDVCKFRS